MGVIRKLGNKAPVISFSEESINSLGISQPPTPSVESETSDDEPQLAVTPRYRDPALIIQRLEHHRHQRRAGARRTRRENNSRALQTLLEDEWEGTNEPSISDFQPKTESAFTKLLTSNDDMRVWQYFISQSEKAQEEYLEAICSQRRSENGRIKSGVAFIQPTSTIAENEPLPEAEGGFTLVPAMKDCRYVHPAYNSEQRFCSIEPHLRAVLKRRHIAMGMLECLEEEILDIFTADSQAVYVTRELSSYERLLLHAICQFSILDCKSSTIGHARRTKVENKGKCFHAPEMTLTQYIETYYRNN